MKFTKLCLVVTDRCNAECDFCCFSCSPSNHQVMDIKFMTRIIHEAKELGMNVVSFSGGEPFLYPELLREGIRTAREEKMSVAIATNGFWGAWPEERMHDVLTELKPDSIGFSYDFFHRKYIPKEDFFRAVNAAEKLEIKCNLAIADMNGEYSAGRFIHSMSKNKYHRHFSIYRLYRAGRALNMPSEMFLTDDMQKFSGCLYDNKLLVFYNGDVYPCCRHEVFESAMKLGNASDKSLKEVIKSSNVPMICDVLMRSERFESLINTAEKIGLEVPEKVGCSCDYCRVMFGTDERKNKMLPSVEKLYGEMLVRSLLKGESA